MLRQLIAIFLTSICYSVFSCRSPKNVSGTYHSNFAVSGFFGTTVRLKPECSLQYVFQGDLMYDSITGHYTIRNHRLYINFDKELHDSHKLYYRFDNMPLYTDVYYGDTIRYKLFFYIGHRKLYPGRKKVSREQGYSRRKKYLFFGSHYYKRRWYLKLVK